MSLRVSKPEFNVREKLNELDRPVGTQGNNILQSNTITESFSKIQAGRKNLIINGNMSIAQRGTSTTGITGDTFGACDRWELDLNTAGTWTMEQVGDAPHNTGFTHCTSLTCTASHALGSGGNFVNLRQKVEAYSIKGLMGGTPNAKPLTASFWVKSNEPGKYYVTIYRLRSGTNTTLMSISYTIEQSEVWEFKTITFPPDTQTGYMTTENSEGMQIQFNLGFNQNTYGSAHYGHWHTNAAFIGKGQTNLAVATNNYFRLTGVQLEIGSEHTEFEHRPYEEEMSLCKRYYQQVGPASSGVMILAGAGNGNARIRGMHQLIPEMRATPTTTADTSSENFTFYAYSGGAVTYSSVNGFSGTSKNIHWDFNTSQHNREGLDFDVKGSGARLQIDAEL